LLISDGVSSSVKDILFHIHPKGDEEVNDYRGTHCDERNVNKIFPDGCGGYSHSICNSSTHSKQVPLNKMLKPVHNLKLNKLAKKQAL